MRMESVTSTDEDIIRNHQFIRGVLTGRFKVPGADQTGAHDGEYDTIPPIELLQPAMDPGCRLLCLVASGHALVRLPEAGVPMSEAFLSRLLVPCEQMVAGPPAERFSSENSCGTTELVTSTCTN